MYNQLIIGEPVIFDECSNLLLSPCRSIKHPLGGSIKFDCSQAIRKAFLNKGISSNVIDIMLKSLANNTIEQYNSPLKKWFEFWAEENIDSYHPPESCILDFPEKLVNQGVAYGTFNRARSAISLIV